MTRPAGPPPTSRLPGDVLLSDYRPVSMIRVTEHLVEAARFPAIDAHAHIGDWLTGGVWATDPHRLLDVMAQCNITGLVNLDGRWGTTLERNLDRYDRSFPGRFATFCQLDWSMLRVADGVGHLVSSLRRSVNAGAVGLKVWKDLGLTVRDGDGELVLPGDARLTPVWETAADLGIPVAIHTADPRAFFDPVDERNERLEDLLSHPAWSYASPAFPRFDRLMDSLLGVVIANAATTFIAVHAGNNAEDLAWVDELLSRPNVLIDIAGRVSELGRQPRAARDLITRHPDRVLFASDGMPPKPAEWRVAFRFLETADEQFPYSDADPPDHGRWRISGLDLPDDVLQRVYRTNVSRVVPALAGG